MAHAPHVYRSDIDGLRAVAVVSVVLFHAGVPGFSGGFVGVDVFFVISGYLITSIIRDEMARGTFTVAGFYERRIRRIFPALFAMLAATAIAASFLLLPYDFKEFGESLAAATLFVSNVFFWRTSDYFAGPAHLKPLLHTWSLAVEEQFYILFPLLLVGLRRWAERALAPLLAIMLAASLALCVWGTTEHPLAAFYLAPFRAWELLLGALLAIGVIPRVTGRLVASGLSLAGLGLIAWAVATFSMATEFPGIHALAPCLGAALLIISGSVADTPVRRLLGARPVVFVGLISYSLYLWHWPMLALARHWHAEVLSGAQIGLVLAASFGVAVLSWRYIEQPFRSRSFRFRRWELFRAAGAVMASAAAFGALAHSTNGWKRRFEGYQRPAIYGQAAMRDAKCFLLAHQAPWNYAGLEQCRSGRAEAPMIMVWGDSFAAHLVPGLSAAAGYATGVLQYTASGCPPVLGITLGNRPYCREFNDHALRVIGEVEPEVVVLSARWEMYVPRNIGLAEIQATVDALHERGVKVILAGQSPTFDFAHPYDFVFRKGNVPARVSFDIGLNRELAGIAGASFFDPLPLFCAGGACPLKEGRNFLYFDGGHFSYVGSRRIGDALLEHAKPLLSVSAPDDDVTEEPSADAGRSGAGAPPVSATGAQ